MMVGVALVGRVVTIVLVFIFWKIINLTATITKVLARAPETRGFVGTVKLESIKVIVS